MSQPSLQQVKRALLDAGIEVYRTREGEIHIAERVRLHIMDSGVRVKLGDSFDVEFTGRSQRSDSPSSPDDELFGRVRSTVGRQAEQLGYEEVAADTVRVTDPVDDSKVLDVWYEITYRKSAATTDEAVNEVQQALKVEKYASS